jgi:hypothetical protein
MHVDNSMSWSRSSEPEVSDESASSSSGLAAAWGSLTPYFSSSSLEELKSVLNLEKSIVIPYDLPHDLLAAWIGSSSADQDCKRQQDGAQYKLHDAIVG